jgi:predicted ArsR family transcriptional regulator
MSTILSEGTKKILLDLIKSQGTLLLDDAAPQVGLAKATIRQHLLAMESQGLIKRKYERAGQGRPKVVFEIAQAGQRLYPAQDAVLLRELIEYLKSTGQQKVIQAFFEKYWLKRQEQFEAMLTSHLASASVSSGGKKMDIEARIQVLHKLLEAEGFMPKIKRTKQNVTVRECNCPFPEAILATQLPCKLESEFIKWALKITVNRTGYIPTGDTACTYSGKMLARSQQKIE